MKSSILMATKAGAEWDRYLPALVNQTRPADEIIVVIDRASSMEEQLHWKARWPIVTFVFNEMNIGLTRSLNIGLEKASGEFIFRIDDDDACEPDRIEKQLQLFKSAGADLVASWAVGSEPDRPNQLYLIKCPSNHRVIVSELLKRNILVHSSLAFRREAIARLGGYDSNFYYAQDYALYLSAMRAGLKFAAVPEPLVRRNYRSTSITIHDRRRQICYSCAARILHHARTGSRIGFVQILFRYILLMLVPRRVRKWRRRIFSLTGNGA